MKSAVVVWTLVCFAGCTTTNQTAMTPEQKKAADQQNTVKQGSIIGAVAGTLVGLTAGVGLTVLVAVLTRDSNQAARVGAVLIPGLVVAGGMVGYGKGKEWGKRVARKKAEYANTEEYLLANLADARALRAKAQEEAARVEKNMQVLTRDTNALREKYQRGQATKNQLAKQRAAIASAQSEVGRRIQRLNEEIAGQQAVIKESAQNKNTAAKQALVAEVAALEKSAQEFRQINSQMTQLSARVDL